ncbi:hypothetical protein GOP47_0003198 [Adiantum capillus-veneris]|uniref:Uncharacterized protein n=1 Tax=Adiantum capillus-veneris TaxID=13818 RepID=A0A9D4ZSB0_ADICA|nr:hypothetical protein GOP47_0003198 [Adiantum capillus-veneris]
MENIAPPPELQLGRNTHIALHPPAPSITPLTACGSNAGSSYRCARHEPSMLGFLLGASAVLTVALLCWTVIVCMKVFARGIAQGSNAHDREWQDSTSGGSEEIDANVGKEEGSRELQDARLVLFPGEQKPHTLAVPTSQLLSIVLHPEVDVSPQLAEPAIKARESSGT